MEFHGGEGGSSPDRKKKKSKRPYHRHNANQIQILESMFKECHHPDENQRMQLSADLALSPLQIKFWFQNRRTQMKSQHERADNCVLRVANDKIRCDNILIREALRNVICPSCGPPPTDEDSYFDEQKLRFENAQLKEELDRVSTMAAKYIGRPILQLSPPLHMSSLDLSMGSFSSQILGSNQSLDLDLLPGNSSNLPFQHFSISKMDKSMMADLASQAFDELLTLLQTNEPLWMKSPNNGRDVLDLQTYQKMFHRCKLFPNGCVEASRDSCLVFMDGSALINNLIDSTKWAEIFPTIVTMSKTIEVVSHGINGSLQLMCAEIQVLSPLVAPREMCFLRYCQPVEHGVWVIVDVSYDFPRESNQCTASCHRFPSGCLIQDKGDGYSQVTWVEHVEIEEQTPTHQIYTHLIQSGSAFSAQRWIATLQRSCERFTYQTATSPRDHHGVIPTFAGKINMMQLSRRMVANFCASICTSHGHIWTTVSKMDIRLMVHKSLNPAQSSDAVFSAATTIWLPVSPKKVFDFFKNERMRPQWDILSKGNAVQEVTKIQTGPQPGNCVSILRTFNDSPNNTLILQESSTDASGSMVVYCPVDLAAINLAMSGQETSCIHVLPSGFAISPDAHPENTSGASSSSGGSNSGGSIVTLAFQILMSSLPSSKLNSESINTVSKLIGTTVEHIKAALNCP